jgi:hypothetical protein
MFARGEKNWIKLPGKTELVVLPSAVHMFIVWKDVSINIMDGICDIHKEVFCGMQTAVVSVVYL